LNDAFSPARLAGEKDVVAMGSRVMKLSWNSLRWAVPLFLVLPFGYRATGWFLAPDSA
jgi:hypothetical protein